MKRATRLVTLFLGLLLLAGPGRGAEEIAIDLVDHTGRGFAPDLVEYVVEGVENPAALRLYTPTGDPVALQVSDVSGTTCTVAFVTDLPPRVRREFVLREEPDAPAAAPGVDVAPWPEAAGTSVLSNERLGVVVPSGREETFPEPRPARELPAPLRRFRSGESGWFGAGAILADRPVASWQAAVTARGPVYAEARYELRWADGGYYRARIRVIQGVPVVQVREEFDRGELDGSDLWELDLAAGWQPDTIEWAATAGNGKLNRGRLQPLEEFPRTPERITSGHRLTAGNAWGIKSHLGLSREADWQEKRRLADGAPLAGWVPLHKGRWRRMNSIIIQHKEAGDLRLRLPMSARHATWLKDVVSETSPFSFHRHDPETPPTYGRRLWGLVLGQTRFADGTEPRDLPMLAARLHYGVVGLDRYKDYVLAWPRDPEVTYPRLFFDQQTLLKLRESLAGAPYEAEYADWYIVSLDPEDARRQLATLRDRLPWARRMLLSPTMGHHHQIEWVTQLADSVLAWPDLPAAERDWIRAQLALLAYLHMEPDYSGQGSGDHAGPANMGLARQLYFPLYVALIPDHPMFGAWRAYMGPYVEYHLGINQAPGGGWSEYGDSYHFHGYKAINRGLAGLLSAGAPRLERILAYNADNWGYVMDGLTPPDPQFYSRVMPGLANSRTGYPENLIEAPLGLSTVDEALAAESRWAWMESGRPTRSTVAALDRPWLEPRRRELQSRVVPGIGVYFRAHQGPQETWMWLRSGYMWGHWTQDQGHMMLYSRGSVLLPCQPFQYWWWTENWDRHNVLRFGHPDNRIPHAWADSNILASHFGPSVEYAWSSTGFPDWFINPGKSRAYRDTPADTAVGTGADRPLSEAFEQTEGAMWWDRQVLFLKGETATAPNYFAVRDTTTGPGRLASWMFWNFLGREENVRRRGSRLAVETEFPTKLDLLFAEELPEPAVREEDQVGGPYLPQHNEPWFRLAPGRAISPHWFHSETNPRQVAKTGEDPTRTPPETDRKGNFPNREEHVFLRFPAAPGEGYFYLLYPRGEAEPLPETEVLAEGVMRVQTPAGTDYVFLAPRHLSFANDEVTFRGGAGAVRVTDETVTLALARGAGEVGFRGRVLTGTGPFEKTFPLADRQPGRAPAAPAAFRSFVPELPQEKGRIDKLAPGVRRHSLAGATLYALTDADGAPARHTGEGVDLAGRQAWVFVRTDGTVRFVAAAPTYVRLSVGNVGIRGTGPFDLTFTADGVEGTVDGQTRTLVCTWPDKLTRPGYWLDGVRYFAHFADDHAIRKGTPGPQFAIAFGVTGGEHRVRLAEWTYPAMPPTPPRRRLSAATGPGAEE